MLINKAMIQRRARLAGGTAVSLTFLLVSPEKMEEETRCKYTVSVAVIL